MDNPEVTDNFQPVQRLMQKGIADGVFPGAVLLVADGETILFHQPYGVADIFNRCPVTRDTLFDLASLTKPLATTVAVMKLVEQGRLQLEQTLGTVLPAFAATDKSGIPIRRLLDHTAGLPDWRLYYKVLSQRPPEERKSFFLDLLVKEPVVHPVGEKTVYSDLGFMILSRVVEKIVGEGLDRFVRREVYRPLSLDDLFFPGLGGIGSEKIFAATEQCPWRKKLLCGEVHDDNAWAAGGVDGHAGLFGTARDVHRLLVELRLAYKGASATLFWRQETATDFLTRTPEAERALGFDVPAAANSSSGAYFSPNSVGHLGFTGTSFWMDLGRDVIVILLTNRVHPSRENIQIRNFRPMLHDSVMESWTGN